MRWLIFVLAALLVLLQYSLWGGDSSVAALWRLDQSVGRQRTENVRLHERNQALEAEVADLKHGLAAIEERARTELGMIKKDEIFYQVVEDPHHAAPAMSPPPPGVPSPAVKPASPQP